ncbi:hypothetical protein [Estrella lausannensis]|uniref:hypothetical protein n=1 Tax=Estrella lausannensis TaxID=483423 RepID=UPI00117B3323|nr:hypothetical protein [Estrella lausannensis]
MQFSTSSGLGALFHLRPKGQKLPEKVYADQGDCGEDMAIRAKKYGVDLETIKRRESKGFVLEAKDGWSREHLPGLINSGG